MKRISLFIAAAMAVAPLLPVRAQQVEIAAPSGWTTQAKSGGARTFTPPDLPVGEVYSVTTYDSVAMNGKTLEEYLRAFAGPVGKSAGKLAKPLQIQVREGRIASGTGVYIGPNGTSLTAMFIGVSLDGGGNIHMARTLFSTKDDILARYQTQNQEILDALVKRAKAETGSNLQVTPEVVAQKLKIIGGELKPGVYAGNQYRGQELFNRFRVYLYANGEYRLCDENDQDIKTRYFDELTGTYGYNRNSGKLNIDWTWGLGTYGDDGWCYYGRDANGKPAIYAEENAGFSSKRTMLTYVAPPTKRPSKSQMAAVETAAREEKARFKWVVAPGKGVPNAQIAAVLLDSKYNGQSTDETTYLLLKDGSVYADLPVPPDELDVQKSKQREPDKWGKWRKVGNTYKVSWAGAPYQNLSGTPVVAAPTQIKLQGRWGTGTSSTGYVSSYALWGVSFDKNGRFKKDSRGGSSSIGLPNADGYVPMVSSGYDDSGSYAGASGQGYAVATSKKNNPNGAREGDYSINGWVLTLRFDNGKVKRLPFFFVDKTRKTLWFEGSSMSRD